MTPRPAPPRALARALVAAATLLALAAPAAADTPERGDFDARPTGADAAGPPSGEAMRERLGRFGLVSKDERTGTARAVAKLDGFLTEASDRPGTRVALDYVRANPRVFGLDGDDLADLRLVDRTFTGGVEYLRWEQRFRGIPSSDTQLGAAVTGAGRLLSVTGPAAADLAVPSVVPVVSAERAYAAARRSGRAARPAIPVRAHGTGADRRTTFADGGTASLVLYQDGDGARLGWRVLAPVSSTEVYDATVDATSGAVVRRANRVDFAADALVYPDSPESPAEPVSLAGWLEAGATRLKGPNVHAFADPQDRVGFERYAVAPEDEVRPVGGDWIFPLDTAFPDAGCAPAGCTWDPGDADSWQRNREQSATQLFYLVNTLQGHLAQQPISFVTGGFSGDDAVLAQTMDGADGPAGQGLPDDDHVNNASFLTLPDGVPGLLQAHLFSSEQSPFGNYDAANDASVIYHEYTHGLTNRLVTDAQGFGALNTAQAGAIDEGTSDFYAMDFLVGDVDDDDDALVEHRLGRYLDGADPDGLRYEAIDCDPGSADALCDGTAGAGAGGFTYEDFGRVYPGPEVHSDGEIWAQTLWDLRQALGVQTARRVITEGLRVSPPEPSFLDMRNAILASAEPADEAEIWAVFAARGMGYFASTDGSTDTAPVADTSVPQPGEPAELSGIVEDEEGDALAGARVGIAGHDTRDRSGGELGPTLAGVTDSTGSYRIEAPVGDYPLIVARKAGHRDDRVEGFDLPEGGGALDFTLVHDWSSAANGATIERHSGPDNTESGCGPGGLIDDAHGSVWGSDRVPGGQRIVIDLGAPIDIAGVAIDPGAGCGDDATAALQGYAISGSTAPDTGFAAVGAAGTFAASASGHLNDIFGTTGNDVRYLELHAKTPQSTAGSGARYLDVAEIHVAKQPGSQPGPSTETEAAQSVSTRTARVRGTVIARAAGVTTSFQYGTTAAYGSTVTSAPVGAGSTAVSVVRDLTGLQPDTTYHYRFVARQNGVDYPGRDFTFTTAPPVQLPPPTPTPTPTPTPVPPDDDPVAATALTSTRLTADRRGIFKVRWTFGDAAPEGTARISVVGKRRKRIASARVAVRPGRAMTKTLRLTRTGRRMIKRGRSLRVSLELRLPGGGTVRERVRLSRKR